MPGNRFGAMQKTVRDMSLAEASPIAEGFPPSDEAGENQLLIKFRPPSTLRQIVGFSPKVPFGSKEENVLLPADRAQIKSSASPKSARPASGLESLFSAPPLSGTRDILPKHVCVHETTVGRTSKIEFPLSSCSHYQHSDVFQNNLKHSHPIPICQSKKPQDEFCTHVQEQQIDQGKLPYDGPVRYRRHTTAFPEYKMLPLRPQRFKLVQESDIENGLILSFSDQNKHSGTTSFATMDFMKACFLCKRKLGHGLDIYMYRGDKAFCSMDCRNHQIVLDERAERREKCSSVALMSESSTKSTRSNHRNRISVASTVAAA